MLNKILMICIAALLLSGCSDPVDRNSHEYDSCMKALSAGQLSAAMGLVSPNYDFLASIEVNGENGQSNSTLQEYELKGFNDAKDPQVTPNELESNFSSYADSCYIDLKN